MSGRRPPSQAPVRQTRDVAALYWYSLITTSLAGRLRVLVRHI